MSLRIRRGTNAQRASITFDLGEIAYTTDTKKLYIGDGTTVGGKHVLATSAGNGFTFNESTQQIEFSLDNLDLDNLNLSTTGVPEGTRLYFTEERAQDAVGAALVAGNPFNVGVTFTYDDENNRITAVSTGAGNSGIASVSADTTPTLGGNLGLNGFNISGSGTISATSLSTTTLTATNLGGNLAVGSYNITGVGNLGATTITATNLGGNLNTGTYNLSGTGAITTNTITATNLGGSINANAYNITNVGTFTATTISASSGLGSGLSLNTHNITGVGDIDIDGKFILSGVTNGTIGHGEIELKSLRADNSSLIQGDIISSLTMSAYTGSAYTKSSVLISQMASNVTSGNFAVDTYLYTLNSDGNFRPFVFRNTGIFEPIAIKLTPLPTEVLGTVTPQQGLIGYDSTLNRAKVYTGSAYESIVTIVPVPSTATSTGRVGQIAYDTTHIYICIATNSWIRADAASW